MNFELTIKKTAYQLKLHEIQQHIDFFNRLLNTSDQSIIMELLTYYTCADCKPNIQMICDQYKQKFSEKLQKDPELINCLERMAIMDYISTQIKAHRIQEEIIIQKMIIIN